MLKKVLSFLLLSSFFSFAPGQDRAGWVDSVFNTLNREAKIGQLFMIPVSTHADQTEINQLALVIKNAGIGQLLIVHGGPLSHAHLLNRLQQISKVPVMAGISAEWGLAQTLDSTMGFHKPLVAAAWKDDSLTRVWAKEIARQMKIAGFHINFAPNADEEITSEDYLRYFGDAKTTVAKQAVVFARVLQSEGIIAVAKHLPRKFGQENQAQDSTIAINLNQADTSEFYAFQQLFNAGIRGILTSNLHFTIQNEKGTEPASLSQGFISELLRKKLHYNGLVFTEVKNFQKSGKKEKPGEAELRAFETGNDILIGPLHLNAAIRKISRRLKKDKALEQQLNASVRKILEAKFDVGLHHITAVETDHLMSNLGTPESHLLKHRLAEAAVTLVSNKNNLLPIRKLESNSFACISIGKETENDFTRYLKKYAWFQTWSVNQPGDTSLIQVRPGDNIVVGIFPYANELENQLSAWLGRFMARQPVVVVHFGNPSSLEKYKNAASLIAAYTDRDGMAEIVPQSLFGALAAKGKLPVEIDSNVYDRTASLGNTGRLSYSLPESAGLDSRTLDKIKVIMKEAIDMGATPGCEVVVAKDGKVVYEQSAGWLTYDNQRPVTEETIYDLASLTKVSATLQAVMFMYEKGLIDINKKASVYLPELKTTNKKDLTIVDLLAHQAGLLAFIPLWPQTVKDSVYLPQYYSSVRNESYPLQVSSDLFAASVLRDSVWSWIVNSRMQDKPPRTPYAYRYSDLGFMMLKQIAEKILNQPLEDFLHQNFYEPLGAYTTGFNPLNRFPPEDIAPTEEDKIYRKSLVAGTVHDERAAMMGGVSGHAGLFSTANDLVKLGQMLLQGGSYGGNTFLKPATLQTFTSRQFEDSRRGLGWDKPDQGNWGSPTTLLASPRTFGHTGFTGTCMWIDPEFNLVFIFLSNRVYPDRSNKLLNANIRARIQEVVYQALFNYCLNKN